MRFVHLWLLLSTLLPVYAQGAAVGRALEHCREKPAAAARLACYDQIDVQRLEQVARPRFAGKLSHKTDVFEIVQPTRLRYQSDGAIFVLALHREDGSVEKNLHIGGGGEDRFLIRQPGRYFLRINGSTTWRIWLEAPESTQ